MKSIQTLLYFIGCILFFSPAFVFSQSSTQSSSAQSQAPTFFFEKDTHLPLVHLSLTFRAGSSHDPNHAAGLTSFVTELMRRGTKHYNRLALDEAFDALGSHLSLDAGMDSFSISGSVLSKNLSAYLKLITEILLNPIFSQKEIRKLKKETISQLLQKQNQDRSLAFFHFQNTLFQHHPYGHPILGKISNVRTFTKSRILKHYRFLLKTPFFLVGYGNSSTSILQKWVKDLRATLQQNASRFPSIQPPKLKHHLRVLFVHKPKRTQTQIYIGHLGIHPTHPLYFPFRIGLEAFGGGSFSSRLMAEIRVKHGWSYGAYATNRYGLYPRAFYNWLFPASKDTPAALKKTLQMIRVLKEKGISKKEFAFTKKRLMQQALFLNNTPSKRVSNQADELLYRLPQYFYKNYAQSLSKVTLEQVQKALKTLIHPNDLLITILGDKTSLLTKIRKLPELKHAHFKVIDYRKGF